MPQAIPESLVQDLPEGLDPDKITGHLTLHSGLTSVAGKTYLLVHDNEMLVLSRVSSVFGFQIHRLKTGSTPTMDRSVHTPQLRLRTSDGIEHWLTLRDIDRDQVSAFFEQMYEAIGDWEMLAKSLEIEIGFSTDADNVRDARLKLAGLYHQHLDRCDDAIDLYEQVLGPAFGVPQAIEGLAAIFARDSAPGRCAQLLSTCYNATGQWRDLVTLKRTLIDATDNNQDRHELLSDSLAILQDKLTLPQEAMEVCAEILTLRPSDLSRADQLELLASACSGWFRAVEIMTASVNAATEPACLDWSLRCARIREHELEDLAGAVDNLTHALVIHAHHTEATESLERVYTTQKAWTALVDHLRYQVSAPPTDDRRLEITLKIAGIFENKLDQVNEAIDELEAVIDWRSDNEEAFLELQRIHTQRGHWATLCALLERRGDALTDPIEKIALWGQAAQRFEESLEDATEAIRIWYKVLDEDAGSAQALGLLTRLLEETGQYRKLVEVLTTRFRGNLGTPKKLAVHLAQVFEDHLADPNSALSWWRRVVDLAPKHLSAHRHILALVRPGNDNEEILAATTALAALVDDQERVSLVESMAELLELLGRRDECISQWRALLDLSPNHERALDELERLYSEDSNWALLLDIYQTRLVLLEEDAPEDQRHRLLVRVGRLYTRLDNNQSARKAWMEVFEAAPGHNEVFKCLEALLTETGRQKDLLALYSTRLQHTEPGSEHLEITRKTARIASVLGQHGAAFDLLMHALEDGWRDPAMLEELTGATRKSRRWSALAAAIVKVARDGVAQQMVRAVADAARTEASPKEQLAVDLWAGALADEKLGDDRLALEFYQRALATGRPDVKVAMKVREKHSALGRRDTDHLEWMVTHLRLGPGDKEEINAELLELHLQSGREGDAEKVRDRMARAGRGSLFILVCVGAVLTLLAGLAALVALGF